MKLTLLPLSIALVACQTSTQLESQTNNAPTTQAKNEQHQIESHVENSAEKVVADYDMTSNHTQADTHSALSPLQAAPAMAKKSMLAEASGRAQPMMFVAPPMANNNERYEAITQNGIFSTAQSPVSTFSIDVDTASYTNVRRFLSQGQLPPKEAVRIEEMINYFDYGYDFTQTEHPIQMQYQLSDNPWNSETQLLTIGVQAKTQDWQSLPAQNLVFLLDVSGSMFDDNKLPLLQRAFALLVEQLRPQDTVSMVVYAGASGLVLDATSGSDKSSILNALNQLRAGGSTNGAAGIHQAYQQAQQHFIKEGINRVILATDGDFNVGTTNQAELKTLIEQKRESGVYLSILSVGQGNLNDALTEELSNAGNGTAYYIDNFNEARRVFVDRLTSTISTVAKDVKIQIEFNPQQIKEYRLIGYENRMLKEEEFNNDKIDAGDMGAGHSVTAIYEVVPHNSEFAFVDARRYSESSTSAQSTHKNSEIGFLKLRYKAPDGNDSTKVDLPMLNSSKKLADLNTNQQFAIAVASAGEVLRHSNWLDSHDWAWILPLIEQNRGDDKQGYRAEFLQLMKTASLLGKQTP